MGGSVHEDRYGLPLSTNSPEAAKAYRDGIDLMLSAWPGAAEAFDRALAADAEFALAHVARARIHSFYQQGEAARKEAAAARELVARRGTERERGHVETLALAVEGNLPAALSSALKTSRKLSARCGGDVAAARRVRAVRVFRDGGPRPGAAGAVRALRAALRRGLVVPVQLRLGHDRERRGRQGPRHDRARLRHAPRQCLRRACAAACDVRGRIGRGCRCAGHAMDRRLRPFRNPLRPYLLASGARRARSGRRVESAFDL